MPEQWFLVADASGNAVSMGTVVANPLPAGLTAVALSDADAAAMLSGESCWSASARALVAVVPPVPEYVTRWQMRSWLWRVKGIPPATVSAMLEQIQDVGARTQAMIDWGDAPIVRRDHPMIASLGAALGMNAAAVDQGFRDAAALER